MHTSGPAVGGAPSSAPKMVNVARFSRVTNGPALWATANVDFGEIIPGDEPELSPQDEASVMLAVYLERQLRDEFLETAALDYQKALAALEATIEFLGVSAEIVDRGVEQ